MKSHDDQIRSLLATYERSLNTSDAALAASCYTPDGIFMPTTLPTAHGADMEDAYRQIFDAIRLDVTFTIDELVITSDHSAYSLTRSNGTQTVHATGDQTELPPFGRTGWVWGVTAGWCHTTRDR